MDEYKLINKITKIRKGNRIAVIPRHSRDGLADTAIGYNCSRAEGYAVELRAAFEAVLEEFDGEIIKLSTATYSCLKVSVQDIEDVVDISGMTGHTNRYEEDLA